MSYLGVDTVTVVASATAQAWQRAHVQGVGRYLRNLELCEVQTIHQAGLQLWSIFETNPTSDAYFTAAQGTQDAQTAIHQAEALGMPHGKPIYFAVDYVPDAGHAGAICAYFAAVVAAMQAAGDPYVVGVYGNYNVLWWCWNAGGLNNGLRYWQTAGNGSCGQVFPFADLLQVPSTCGSPATLGGVAVDLDVLLCTDTMLW